MQVHTSMISVSVHIRMPIHYTCNYVYTLLAEIWPLRWDFDSLKQETPNFSSNQLCFFPGYHTNQKDIHSIIRWGSGFPFETLFLFCCGFRTSFWTFLFRSTSTLHFVQEGVRTNPAKRFLFWDTEAVCRCDAEGIYDWKGWCLGASGRCLAFLD